MIESYGRRRSRERRFKLFRSRDRRFKLFRSRERRFKLFKWREMEIQTLQSTVGLTVPRAHTLLWYTCENVTKFLEFACKRHTYATTMAMGTE
jgi:serine/threonine-protein kinase RIO1